MCISSWCKKYKVGLCENSCPSRSRLGSEEGQLFSEASGRRTFCGHEIVLPEFFFFKHKFKMTGDCCVFKFLWFSVDGNHFMRFQSENAGLKFLRRSV